MDTRELREIDGDKMLDSNVSRDRQIPRYQVRDDSCV